MVVRWWCVWWSWWTWCGYVISCWRAEWFEILGEVLVNIRMWITYNLHNLFLTKQNISSGLLLLSVLVYYYDKRKQRKCVKIDFWNEKSWLNWAWRMQHAVEHNSHANMIQWQQLNLIKVKCIQVHQFNTK